MSSVTAAQRAYLAAVGLLAVWVGVFCYFLPGMSDWGIPWRLPTLCATFLGAMYLSGAAGMAGGIRAHRWYEIKSLLPMIAIWTGMLTVVSLFYLPLFDFARTQVQIWFAAYIAYPLIAMAFLWVHRSDKRECTSDDLPLSGALKRTLIILGLTLTALSLVLLFAPRAMLVVWPWKTGPLMLQLYSAPFLSYGLGTLNLARQQTWLEIRVPLLASLVFVGAELVASLVHAPLFDGPVLSIAVWFIALALMTGILLRVFVLITRSAAQSLDPRRQDRIEMAPVSE
jgi:hypothetical protein